MVSAVEHRRSLRHTLRQQRQGDFDAHVDRTDTDDGDAVLGGQHCSSTEKTCHASNDHPSVRQRRDVEVLSVLTGTAQPTSDEMVAMGSAGVDAWLKRQWDVFMDGQPPAR